MTSNDDVSRLLDAAIAAAGRPQDGALPSDEVAELLAKAEHLARNSGGDPVDSDDVVAFLAAAKGRIDASSGHGQVASTPPRPAVQPDLHADRSEGAGGRPKAVIAVIALAVLGLIGFSAYAMTRPPASPAQNSQAASASDAPVDSAQVAALMEKLASNPKDVDSLWSLGNMYYGANDFTKALGFYEKIAAIAPKDDSSWIPVAAAAFQGGDESRALEAWTTALEINPDNIQAHYGLGHYYLNQTPTDEAKARASFEKVIALDPNSEQAKEVQKDLATLGSPAAPATPASS